MNAYGKERKRVLDYYVKKHGHEPRTDEEVCAFNLLADELKGPMMWYGVGLHGGWRVDAQGGK